MAEIKRTLMTSETPVLRLTSAGCERFLGPNSLLDLSLAPSTQRHAWMEEKATEQAWFSEGVQHSHSELGREASYGLTRRPLLTGIRTGLLSPLPGSRLEQRKRQLH